MHRRFIAIGPDGDLAAAVRSALPDASTLSWHAPGNTDGDVVVLIEPPSATIRDVLGAHGERPVLLLRSSALPGRVDLDWVRPPPGASTRRARLAQTMATLDDGEILAEAGSLAWPAGAAAARPGTVYVVCDTAPSGTGRDAMAHALGDDLLAAAETAASTLGWTLCPVTAATLPGEAQGAPVILPAFSPSLWPALAGGAETILCGLHPDPPGACHAAADAAGLSRALRDVAAGARRNARDSVMKALAVESLFVALPAAGPAFQAALREELALGIRRPPRVTIVVNCYNYREYVRDAVLSACRQTDPADQIVVVDDGSTDGSMDTLEGIEGLTILRKPNAGQASAFNEGLAAAMGDLVLFLDADDRLLPMAVERLRRAWRPGLSRLQFALETIDAHGHATGLYPDAATLLSGDLTGRIAGWGNYPFMPTSGNIYAAAALRAVMPIPQEPWRLCADHYLNVLTPFEGEVASIPDVLGQYRVHDRNGHFHVFGDLAFRELHHLKYRVRVWRDLMDHLAARQGCRDMLRRLQVHRRLLAAAADPRTAALVSWPAEALAALKLAVRAGSLRRAAAHLGFAIRCGLLRLWPDSQGGPATAPIAWPWPAPRGSEDVLVASSSQWPVLVHGTEIDARSPGGLAAWPGWGWSGTGRGLPVEAGPIAQLAFRLPLHPSHWMLRLHLAKPLPDRVAVDLNGRRLLDQGAPGDCLDIPLPAELLRREGDARACDLTLRSLGVTPLRAVLLSCRALPRAPAAAPAAVEGRWLALADRTAAAFALGSGWSWPAAGAVAAEGQRARLRLMLAPDHRHWMLRLRCARLGPSTPIVFLDGTRCPVFASEDGRTLTLRGQRRRGGSGPVAVDLVAPRGESLDLAVEALRADRLQPGQAAFDEPQEGGPGDIDMAGMGSRGPVPLPATLTLSPPVAGGDCRALLLILRDEPDGELAQILVTGPGLRTTVVAAHAAEIRLPLEDCPGSTILAFGPGRSGMRLQSVTLTHVSPRSDIVALATGGVLDGDGLADAALHPGDWMEPVEGAMWLRGAAGLLAVQVDRAGPAPVRLTLDVLCLPGEGLEVSCEGKVVAVSSDDPRTIALDLAPQAQPAPTVVAVRTRTLVPLPSPVPTSGLIGGAVTRIAVTPG